MSAEGEIKTVKSTHRWEIPEFCLCTRRVKEKFTSPTFTSHGLKWLICLYSKQDPESKVDYISIYLSLRESSKIEINCTFGILGQDGKVYFCTKNSDVRVFEGKGATWGYSKFVRISLLNYSVKELLIDGKLEIECQIFTRLYEEDKQNSPTEKTSLTEFVNFEKFLFSETLSDVRLIVDEEEIYAHKFILAARSDVFAAMFIHETKESAENKVKIDDLNLKVVKEMLRYMYTHKINEIEKIVEELLAVADKYMLNELKSICESNLIESLSNSNICDRMLIANKYDLYNLKKKTISFIALNSQAITDEIQSLQVD